MIVGNVVVLMVDLGTKLLETMLNVLADWKADLKVVIFCISNSSVAESFGSMF